MRKQNYFQLLGIISEVLSGQTEDSKWDDEQTDRCIHNGLQTQESYTSGTVYRDLLKESISHHLFPVIVDGLLSRENEEVTSIIRSRKVRELYRSLIIRQAQKTADFLLFYDYLASMGLYPIVMKGIICRSLYPQPEHRSSVDEDLLIDPSEFDSIHNALLAYGLEPVLTEDEIRTAWEVSYESREKHLYIEIHKMPFAPDAKAYAYLNECFEGAMERSIEMEIYATSVRTLGYTDHLLYLILHAFKHFLYSGFGIRQVCDIGLFSESFGDEIDWIRIKKELQKVSALEFAGALFKINDKYLLKKNHFDEYLHGWNLEEIDEEPLMRDILVGGIYGVNDIDRAHSVKMTLNAAAFGHNWRTRYSIFGILNSVFPGKRYLQRHYSYAMRFPLLLPIAWVHRIMQYISDKNQKHSDPMKSIRIGQDRVALLRKYNIINKGNS